MSFLNTNVFKSQRSNTELTFNPNATPVKYITDRVWQSQSHDLTKDAKSSVICGFPGVGKTHEMQKKVAYKSRKGIKTIIIAPYRDIVKNTQTSYLKDGDNNVCVENTVILDKYNNSDELLTFIKSDVIDIPVKGNMEFIRNGVVCTHSTFMRTIQDMTTYSRKKYLKNVCVLVDECHHSMFKKYDDGTSDTNILNNSIALVRKYANSVHLYTATFFRSDGYDVTCLPKGTVVYECDILSHLKDNCVHLKEIRSVSSYYKGDDFVSGVETVLKDSYEPTIIWIPNTNSKLLTDNGLDKYKVTKDIIKVIGRNNPDNLEIINLVDDTKNRDRLKDYIKRDNENFKKTGKYKIGFIICMSMFKEGSDYIPLSRSITIGHRDSEVFLVQSSLGRIGRDAFGKKVATAHVLNSDRFLEFNDVNDVRRIETHNKSNILSYLMLDYNIFKNNIHHKYESSDRSNGAMSENGLLSHSTLKRILSNAFNEMSKLRFKLSYASTETKHNKFRSILKEEFDKVEFDGVLPVQYIDREIEIMVKMVCYQTLKFENKLGDITTPTQVDMYTTIDPYGSFDAIIQSAVNEQRCMQYKKTIKDNAFDLDISKGVNYGVSKLKQKTKNKKQKR
jgi:hypothetical protein